MSAKNREVELTDTMAKVGFEYPTESRLAEMLDEILDRRGESLSRETFDDILDLAETEAQAKAYEILVRMMSALHPQTRLSTVQTALNTGASITESARQLGISKQALSKGLKKIRQRLRGTIKPAHKVLPEPPARKR